MRAKRAAIDIKTREIAAKQAAKLFIHHPLFHTSQHIACYIAGVDEFDCTLIIEAIWAAGKNCYLPVLTPEKQLEFFSYQRNDKLSPNRYGIPEPHDTQFIATAKLDVILAPLVAFDRKGHRLGMGGGYYDRTLAFLLNQSLAQPKFIGLSYACQEVPALTPDAWDVALQGVITEEDIYVK